MVWNRTTGRPYYNAIVRQDTRTDHIAAALDRNERGDIIRRKAGLPPPPTFPGKPNGFSRTSTRSGATPNVVRRCSALTDTWVLWNLTGDREAASTSPTSPMPAAPC